MKNLLTFLILASASLTAFAQSESKCFQNEGLHGDNLVVFEISGTKFREHIRLITAMRIPVKAYEFTGTLDRQYFAG